MKIRTLFVIHILLGVITSSARAEPITRPVITKFDKEGNIHWNDVVPDAAYRVEWATSLDGNWHSNLQHLDSMLSGSNKGATRRLPVFYRVVRIGTDRVERPALESASTGQHRPATGVYHHQACLKSGRIMLHASNGLLSFGGAQWMPWRTLFGFEGDRLTALPRARPGFNYGHSGHGRGPTLVSNVGNTAWKDYRMECTFGISGVSDRFNPYGLSEDFGSGRILFHVVDAKESWNKKGSSWYSLRIEGNGDWGLGCGYNSYCDKKTGWGNRKGTGGRSLARGSGLKIDKDHGNRIRIDIIASHIQVWVDGEQIANVHDDKMLLDVDGIVLDHGGVGFHWIHDCMGWISDFSIQHFEQDESNVPVKAVLSATSDVR